jgi:flagellar protein FliL
MEKIIDEKIEDKIEEPITSSAEKKGFNVKLLLFGIPVFVVQLIAVYFVTANILLNKIQGSHSSSTQTPTETKQDVQANQAKSNELGKFVFMVDDLIINPANTDGKRLLLSSLGFDVPTEKDNQELKSKEPLLKDAIISVMSSKEMSQLSNISYRDTLRIEITKRLSKLMPSIKINTIYFSKYILQ